MGITTKKGDEGYTSLFSGERVKKYDLRPQTYGKVDELTSFLGLAILNSDYREKEVLQQIQKDLILIMGELASTKEKIICNNEFIENLEKEIEYYQQKVGKIKEFISSGYDYSSTYLHIARSLTRNVERKCVKLFDEELINNQKILIYFNRLSDLLFLIAYNYQILK